MERRHDDFEPTHELNRAFEAWIAQNLPEVHSQITWIDLGSPAATYEDQTVLDTSFAEFIAASDVYPLGD